MFSNSDVSCRVYEAPEAARSFDGLDASECAILTWGFAGSYQQIALNVYSSPCWLLPFPRTLLSFAWSSPVQTANSIRTAWSKVMGTYEDEIPRGFLRMNKMFSLQ